MSSYLFYMQEQFALVRKRAPTASVRSSRAHVLHVR
jgi:hypothetical protein